MAFFRARLFSSRCFRRSLFALLIALLTSPLDLSAQAVSDSESRTEDSKPVPNDTGTDADSGLGSDPDTLHSISMAGPRTLRAILIEPGKITLDGELDEPEWQSAELAAEFVQNEPFEGQPASEPTKVRLLYDKENLYIGAICYDSAGEKGFVSRELKRDFSSRDNDIFQVVFDTFNDRRNSVVFAVNPAGAVRDMQTAGDGGSFNSEWDAVWDARTRTTEEGWQAEFVIPFKSLRFDGKREQTWGMNFERRIRRKNEATHWSPIPRPHRVYRVSQAGSLHGITDVQQGRNLYIKPYVSVPFGRAEGDDWDFKPDAGLDVKYGVTSKMTLDLTLNTDFSQVEADDAQINFTRFSLFFPEKREFFLENQQVFEFGNVGNRGGGRRRGGPSRPGADLIPFFSRRIGINDDGELIPILGGARMTGRLGSRYTLGLISMQSGEFEDIPSTNFTVGRFRRDMLRNSDIGVIFVNKAEGGDDYNRTYGADMNFRFFEALELSSYFLKTSTPGLAGKDSAGFFRAVWRDRLLDLEASHISIDDNFNAEVGFVRRVGIKKTSGQIAFTPRPEGKIPWIREFRPSLDLDYITNQEGQIEGREVRGRFSIEFNDSSRFSIGRQESFERLFEADEVLDHILEPGDYGFGDFSVSYSTDSSRMFSAFVEYRDGEFYDGERTSRGFGLDFSPNAKFLAGISWDHGDLEFPTEVYSTELVSSRIDYSLNTRMFISSLIQYSSRDGFVASNIRFRWIHRPLSDFYLVYNERRTTQGEVLDRALIAKLTYLFSF